MRLCLTLVTLCLLALTGILGTPADAAAPTVSAGQLKVEGLSELTKGGKVKLVGFAWDGPARLFATGFAADGLVAATTTDHGFSVAAEGPAALCQGLKKLGADKTTLEQGRLSFQSSDGPLKALKLGGITVGKVDCAARPWTADLQVANVEDAETKTKGEAKAKTKKKKKAKSKVG